MRWSGKEKVGNHEPLIDKTTYDLNQYVLAKHRDFLIRQRKHNFLLLRAFIFCEDCGQRYTAEWHYHDKKLAKMGGKIHLLTTVPSEEAANRRTFSQTT